MSSVGNPSSTAAGAVCAPRTNAVINGGADVNQLVPFKIHLGVGPNTSAAAPTTGCRKEINMQRDIELWKRPTSAGGLADDERLIVQRNLGFFVTADSGRQQHRARHLSPHPPRPSAGNTPPAPGRLKRRSTPTPTSTSFLSLGLDEAEIFNAYHEIKCIRDKDEFLIPFIDVLTNPNFKTVISKATRSS